MRSMRAVWASPRITIRARGISFCGRDLAIEFIRMAYDVEQAAQAIDATDMPDEFAAMPRGGAG